MNQKLLLSAPKAAEYLAQELPMKAPEKWLRWLANNRNPARAVSMRIPFEKLARGEVFYSREELQRYVELEKSLRTGAIKFAGRVAEAMRGFGLGEPGSTSQGRVWKGATVTLQPTNGGGIHVSFIVPEPLAVFRLTPAQAMALALELQEAAQAAQRIADDAPRTDLKYKTITDNQTVMIERLVVKGTE